MLTVPRLLSTLRDMAVHLTRSKPDPVPDIHPVPDYRAGSSLQAVYADTKQVLQVPWMGVVTMAFAHYPNFWNVLWRGVRPLAQSTEFVAACKRLRLVAESGVAEMAPADLLDELEDMGYARRELNDIRDLIEIFSHGNMPYLLIATMARLLLEGHDLSQRAKATPTGGRRHGPNPDRQLVLMEPHHADQATVKVYAELRSTLGLPFVNTDYRALARWPSYFRLAWSKLRPLVGSVDHLAAVEAVHNEAVALSQKLPNPAALNSADLIHAAETDAPLDEVQSVVQLFQWLLPELVVNVSCLRAQIAATSS